MKNALFSLFAIFVAGFAAVAATTAMLNMPVRTPRAVAVPVSQVAAETPPPAGSDAGGAKPAPSATAPAKPATPAAGAAAGAPAAAAPANADDEPDKDPYEGINPEELPPDLQYNADSSVSFPTNI